jgi:translation initiation factor eIF-2B subunit alpha/methylthioribose-1-phosphate isomerase
VLKTARPTAVDLKHAVDYVLARVAEGQGALEAARDWDSDNSGRCMRISRNGAGLINNKSRILTHCNTGFLAADSYGTALGAIVEANRSGKEISVLVDETRPRIQGSLTSWELLRQKVEHRVIADSAAGYLMAKGEVDMVMLGADRIASNGDFANKIGTYSLSVLAKENNVPFYVLAPISTYDFSIADGSEIEVENRDEDEVLSIKGKRAYPKGTRALNPAFDITPAKNVTAYINEWGTFEQIGGIRKKWNDMMG